MDWNDDIHHNNDIQDKEKEQASTENESDDNTCQDVDMEMQDTAYGELQDNGKATKNKGNVHELERHDRLYEIFQHDSETAGNGSSKEQDIANDAEVINDRREHNSNESAVNLIELNVSAAIADDDDADSQKTLDLDDLDKQDVSSLHSSDDSTLTKLAFKLSKSTCEKDKPKRKHQKERHKNLIAKNRLVLEEEEQNHEQPNAAATKQKATGIINIKKTSFYQKRKEKMKSRTLNITHHGFVNPTSHLTEYYYESSDIRKTMILVK